MDGKGLIVQTNQPIITTSIFRFDRILDDHSLFNYKPVHYRLHPTEKPFCLCTLNSNIKKKKKCASCEAKCRRHQHVIWPVLFRERDITKRVLALQTGRVLERRSNQSKGDHYLRYHLTNQLNLSDEGKPDTFLAVLAVVSYCKRLLTDTPLGKACIHLVGQRIVDQLQRICIRDTRVLPLSFSFFASDCVCFVC